MNGEESFDSSQRFALPTAFFKGEKMTKNNQNNTLDSCSPFNISDDDVLKAMKDINGYLDITPGDFKELYRLAFTRAVKRLTNLFKARDVMTKKVFFIQKSISWRLISAIKYEFRNQGIPDGHMLRCGGVSKPCK